MSGGEVNFVECQLPMLDRNGMTPLRGEWKSFGNSFPLTESGSPNSISNCQFIVQGTISTGSRGSSVRSRNKFILMRGLLNNLITQITRCRRTHRESNTQSALKEVSQIASWLWKQNNGRFQNYYEALAVFEEKRETVARATKQKSFKEHLVLKKLTEAIGRECIPSTYSYETLTNGADTTEPEPMESKNTYKAFCGRFRVRKKKPIQTVAVRWAKIEDVFLI